METKPIVIAEIGAVHIGKVDRAKELIRLATLAGANVVKFQKRNPYESTPELMRDKPHPNDIFSYGKTYLDHRIKLELNIDQHRELMDFCTTLGITYSTSVWDITSAKEVVQMNPKLIKVPSAQNHNTDLLNYLYKNYEGEIHISLGMTTKEERLKLRSFIYERGLDRTVVYHCTSAYPCPFDRLYLNEIKWLKDSFEHIGFSNHGYGIAADIAALTLGARYFERHFIDDRTFRHTDAAASLEADGLKKLCRDLKNVNNALSSKPIDLDQLEQEQRAKLRG